MPLTNAEKQAGWRERNLKNENGTKLRAQFIFDASTRAQLKRIACHKGCSVTPLIKEWAASAERRITHQLSGKAANAILRWRIDEFTMSAVTGSHNNRSTQMSEQATLKSIGRSGPPEEFSPDLPRGGTHTCSRPFQARFRCMGGLLYNHISVAGAMSVTLTNAEKQVRYRERYLGVDGEKVRVAFNLIAVASAKMNRPRTPQW